MRLAIGTHHISRCRISVFMSSISLKRNEPDLKVSIINDRLTLKGEERDLECQVYDRYIEETHKRNFSSHRGLSVCGFTEVARMYLAGTAPPSESRCSRRFPCSLRLKESLKLIGRLGSSNSKVCETFELEHLSYIPNKMVAAMTGIAVHRYRFDLPVMLPQLLVMRIVVVAAIGKGPSRLTR